MNHDIGQWGRCVLVCLLLAGCCLNVTLSAGEPSMADQALVAKVAARFFAIATPVEGWAWPPLVGIAATKEVNAFASLETLKAGQKPAIKDYPSIFWIEMPVASASQSQATSAVGENGQVKQSADAKPNDAARPQPYIVFLQGYLDSVVKGREVYLAETCGHELAHVLLQHVSAHSEGAPLVAFAMTRQQESDADLLGMNLALQGDYPYDELIKAVRAWRDYTGPASTLAALRQTHPGWTDRAALIDSRQPELWTSISAFENGVYFLMAENYHLAERCFSQVVKEMPHCYEAWANRGYARLMRYCDALEPEDLKELALSHVVIGGFYRRAGSLEERGVNTDLWFDAVGDLREALRIKDSLILPKANLALAYLVHPSRKELGKATELFEQVIDALKQVHLDEPISPIDQAALLVNAGVSEQANGDSKAAKQFFDRARAIYLEETKTGTSGPIKSAILYSQATQLAGSSDVQERRQAAQIFEEYLATTSPAVAWWTLAYDRYKGLCQSDQLDLKPREKLIRPQSIRFRPVTGLAVNEQDEISINDLVTQATDLLGEGVKSTVVRRTNIHRLKYEQLGLELLCTDRVIAIRLRKAQSPPLILRPSGPGEKVTQVRVGMPLAELHKVLAGDEAGWDKRYGAQYSITYQYFSRLNFGVDVDEKGNIAEIIVAQIPPEAIVK